MTAPAGDTRRSCAFPENHVGGLLRHRVEIGRLGKGQRVATPGRALRVIGEHLRQHLVERLLLEGAGHHATAVGIGNVVGIATYVGDQHRQPGEHVFGQDRGRPVVAAADHADAGAVDLAVDLVMRHRPDDLDVEPAPGGVGAQFVGQVAVTHDQQRRGAGVRRERVEQDMVALVGLGAGHIDHVAVLGRPGRMERLARGELGPDRQHQGAGAGDAGADRLGLPFGAGQEQVEAGGDVIVILDRTPFYAESGGQVGDIGVLTGEGVKFRVTDMQKKAGDLFVHVGTVEQGTLKAGTALQLEVDHARRSSIRANHSATHLLHEALRQVLGDHIAQRGSLVAPDRLRFDFVHPKPITPEELARVEDIANDVVLENDEVTTRVMAVDDAREAGARALFGEKYGDEVRVVSMGKSAREHGQNALGWSVELCGGTHVRRTGDIGLISVTSESAVASGVRRIEALTGRHARKHANDTMALAKTAAAELRTTIEDVPARITALMEERKKLERDLSDARKKLAMGGGGASNGAASAVREVGNVKLLARAVEGVETKDLKSLVDDGKKQIGSGVVAIVGVTEDGKAGIVVGVTADLTSRFNAVELVRKGSEVLGGKGGGGRPDMAQAGGPDGAKADAALSAIEQAMAGA